MTMAMDKLWSKGFENAFAGTEMSVSCYTSHPVLKMGKGKLCGGRAYSPAVKDADIYVVLNSGDMRGVQSDPWDEAKVIEIQYSIRDMHAPENVPRFKKMVTWLCNQLQAGKKVHVGCIGGHGRTGTVLAAIVAEMGQKDAIGWIRKHYCKKAVESKEQIDFLVKHYGVEPAVGTKSSLVQRKAPKAPEDTEEDWKARGFTSTTATTPYSQRQKGARGAWEAHKAAIESKKDVLAKGRIVKVERVSKANLPPKGASKSFAPMASVRSLWNKAEKKG